MTKCRWWASVVLFIALVPIFCLYLIWLPLTVVGAVKAADIPENDLARMAVTSVTADLVIEETSAPGAVAELQDEMMKDMKKV
jgi:hypothetical protein